MQPMTLRSVASPVAEVSRRGKRTKKTLLRVGKETLDGQFELLALHHLGVVNPEEVRVQDGLDNAGDDGDPVDLVVHLGEVTVDPVGDVQGTVDTEGSEVVGSDGLGLASTLEHEELGQDGDGLEPDGEGPEDLPEGVVVGEDDGQGGGASKQVLDAERVLIGVIGGLVGGRHQVDDVALGGNEENLEDQVPEAAG